MYTIFSRQIIRNEKNKEVTIRTHHRKKINTQEAKKPKKYQHEKEKIYGKKGTYAYMYAIVSHSEERRRPAVFISHHQMFKESPRWNTFRGPQ
jgi:hypothetical protein